MCNSVVYNLEYDRFYYQKEAITTNKPITLCYHIGYECNLDCDYCLSKNVASQPITTDLSDFIQYISNWKPLRLVISGGEPLIYMDKLVRILSGLKEKGINTFVSTNGILITKEYSRLRGLVDWYDISLPAIRKSTYSKVRGKDKFEEILEGIALLKRNHERVRLTFTVNEENKNEMLDFPQFALSLGVDNIRIGHTFSNVDGALEKNLWWDEYRDMFLAYEDKMKVYLPLSQHQMGLYNEGYIIVENDGAIYRGMVNKENYICHISEVDSFNDTFVRIGSLQRQLFVGDYNE